MKKEKNAAIKAKDRDSQRHLLYKEKKFYQKCEDRLPQAKDDDEYQKWQKRRYESQKRLQRIEEQWEARLRWTQGLTMASMHNA